MASKPAARHATSTAATHFGAKPVAAKRPVLARGASAAGAVYETTEYNPAEYNPAQYGPKGSSRPGVRKSANGGNASLNGSTKSSKNGSTVKDPRAAGSSTRPSAASARVTTRLANAPVAKQTHGAAHKADARVADMVADLVTGNVADKVADGAAHTAATTKPACDNKTVPSEATGVPTELSKATAREPAAEDAAPSVQAYADALIEGKGPAANQAAEVVGRLALEKPEALVPAIERLTRAVSSKVRRSAQAASDALPALARIAPARVAKHLDALKLAYDEATPIGRDGLVRTFSALCSASVAYQKRLEPMLTEALRTCDGKSLVRWSQTVLPSLKGEPHARARLVVEARLYEIPRPYGIKLGEVLGVRLRPAGR